MNEHVTRHHYLLQFLNTNLVRYSNLDEIKLLFIFIFNGFVCLRYLISNVIDTI